ncbi:MAG: hypothetical protein KAT23_02955, partial [Anaerolineales bacterium]|nr:hypothetical protein [Anaerolineales bacterium]
HLSGSSWFPIVVVPNKSFRLPAVFALQLPPFPGLKQVATSEGGDQAIPGGGIMYGRWFHRSVLIMTS